MGKQKQQKKTYPEDLERNALNLLRTSGKSGFAIARVLGIEPEILNRWRGEEERERDGLKAFPGQGIPRVEEVARLQRKNKDLREANEILKKAIAIFSVKGSPK